MADVKSVGYKVWREWPEEGKSQKVQEGTLINSKKMLLGGDVKEHLVIDCDDEECVKISWKFLDTEHWRLCWGGGRGKGGGGRGMEEEEEVLGRRQRWPTRSRSMVPLWICSVKNMYKISVGYTSCLQEVCKRWAVYQVVSSHGCTRNTRIIKELSSDCRWMAGDRSKRKRDREIAPSINCLPLK